MTTNDRLAEILAHRDEHGFTFQGWLDGAWLAAELVSVRAEAAEWRENWESLTEGYEAALSDYNRARADLAALRAERDALRRLLAELYDGDACDCSAGPGEPHEAECFQTRVEAAL